MKEGIAFEISTTSFEQAVNTVEQSFDIYDIDEWLDVRKSKDFKKLSDFLTAMSVDNKIF